jgi:secondary thiamine-phosphate synthase enzyme
VTLFQKNTCLDITTPGPGMVEITRDVENWLGEAGVGEGILTLYIRHTSASLTIQENADRDVQTDLVNALDRLAPQSSSYHHQCEGPDDMPAHIKSALTSTSLTVPVIGSKMALGTWQGIYVMEHRARPHTRQVVLQYTGS